MKINVLKNLTTIPATCFLASLVLLCLLANPACAQFEEKTKPVKREKKKVKTDSPKLYNKLSQRSSKSRTDAERRIRVSSQKKGGIRQNLDYKQTVSINGGGKNREIANYSGNLKINRQRRRHALANAKKTLVLNNPANYSNHKKMARFKGSLVWFKRSSQNRYMADNSGFTIDVRRKNKYLNFKKMAAYTSGPDNHYNPGKVMSQSKPGAKKVKKMRYDPGERNIWQNTNTYQPATKEQP